MNLARQKNYFVIENYTFDKFAVFTKSRIDFKVDFCRFCRVLKAGSFSIQSISTAKYFSIFDLGYISYFTY